jgi:hypothetical protein
LRATVQFDTEAALRHGVFDGVPFVLKLLDRGAHLAHAGQLQ